MWWHERFFIWWCEEFFIYNSNHSCLTFIFYDFWKFYPITRPQSSLVQSRKRNTHCRHFFYEKCFTYMRQRSIRLGLRTNRVLYKHLYLAQRREDLLTRVLILPLKEIPIKEGFIRVLLLSLLKILKREGDCTRHLKIMSLKAYVLRMWSLWLAINLENTWLRCLTLVSLPISRP